MEQKLTIEIHNSKPVSLMDLVATFSAFEENYRIFLEKHDVAPEKTASILTINELRSGSIIAELIPYAPAILPLLNEHNTVYEFLDYTRNTFRWLMGKGEKPSPEPGLREIKNAKNVTQTIKNDENSSMTLINGNGKTIVNNHYFNFGHEEAKALHDGVEREILKSKEQDYRFWARQLMVWDQAKFSGGNAKHSKSNKARIEGINSRALPVIFEDPRVKEQMMTTHEGFEKPWQKLAYRVDVNVETIDGKPSSYKIMRWYPDDTYDPEDD